ncbi:MAG: PEP-CTERM sorting domain-containing protein [Phycisphaerae bacterium]|nr:PEP-CTERM sorting domain-containing protein [Phycisphaerae bacterium]
MSKWTIFVVAFVVMGLMVAPAFAVNVTKLRDQHIGPDHNPGTPAEDVMHSHMIQYDLMSPENYWRGATQHIDEYNGWSFAMPTLVANGERANLLEFDTLIGTGENQIPLGATIIEATLWLRRTNWGDATVNLGVYPVLDPDGLGHWGVSPGAGGYEDGAAWSTRDSIVDPDVPWTLVDDKRIDENFVTGLGNDFLGPADDVNDMAKGSNGFWLVTSSLQAWCDGMPNQGWVIMADSGDGEIFAGQNDLNARPLLTVTWIPEPMTLTLLGVGLLGVIRRRKH